MGLEAPLTYQVQYPTADQARFVGISFQIDAAQAAWLHAQLQPVLAGREVIVRLAPQDGKSWVLYCKTREGDSRSLFAHPDSDEWVGTLALETAVWSRFFEKLQNADAFTLDSICRLGGMSNLRIEFNSR
jgi:hypothetical protein